MCQDTGSPDILHVHSTADTVIFYGENQFSERPILHRMRRYKIGQLGLAAMKVGHT